MLLAFHNPASGQSWHARRKRRALEMLARMPGMRLVETTPTDTVALVRSMLTPDVRMVFACGGDGTVSEVAAALEDTDISLGIVPVGSTNVLAREFGIPLDPRRAVAALQRGGPTCRLRLWKAGERRVLEGAGIGWDARLMHRVNPFAKRHLGYMALGATGTLLGATYEFPRLTVTGVDSAGHAVSITGTSVLAANVRYWCGANETFPLADPTDDLLEVIVLERSSFPQLVAFWLRMMVPGLEPLRLAGVRTLQLRSVTVTSDAPGGTEVHVNGEAAGYTPLVLERAGTVRIQLTAERSPRA